MKKKKLLQRGSALLLAAFLLLQSPATTVLAVETGKRTGSDTEFSLSEPVEEPTEAPTAEPTQEPTEAPTAEPTQEPTEAPTAEPAQEPTEAPTAEPTQEPTEAPTAEPTQEPTQAPAQQPVEEPTEEPTQAPSETPATAPTEEPTPEPSAEPSAVPTSPSPSVSPTPGPTQEPAPMDITAQMALGLVKAELPGQEPMVIKNSDGTLDLSAMDADKTDALSLEFSFAFLESAEIRNIHSGDTFTINLRTLGLTFADTLEPLPIFNRKNREDADLTDDLLGSYTVKNQVLTVTLGALFSEKEALPSIIGRIALESRLDKAALSGEITENTWQLSDTSAVTLLLPALYIPGDITNKMNQVELALTGATLGGKSFSAKGGLLNITLPAQKEKNDGTLRYDLTVSGKKGDKVVLPLPTPVFALGALQSRELSGIGTLAAENGKAVFTLTEEVKEAVVQLDIPVTLNRQEAQGLKDGRLSCLLQKEGDRENALLLVFSAASLLAAPRAAGSKEVSLMAEWLDYSVVGSRPKPIEDGMLQISFSIDGGAETVLNAGNMGSLGLTAMPKIESTVKDLGVGFEKFYCTLPTTTADGKSIDYRMSMTTGKYGANYTKNAKYMPPRASGDKWVNVICHEFVLFLDIKQGDGKRAPSDFYKDIEVFQTMNAKSLGTLSGLIVTPEGSGPVKLRVSGIPAFDDNKVEHIYYAKTLNDANVIEANEGTDYFERIYMNEHAPNFGTNTTEAHDGGTLRLILTGDGKYTMTKMWLDEYTGVTGIDSDKIANRPDAQLHLWRYSERDNQFSDYTTAAQVRHKDGSNITHTIKNAEKALDRDEVSFQVIENGVGSPLPKYDPEGYPYVYFTRETLSGTATATAGDYEQVFGEVLNDAGDLKDTLPGNVPNRLSGNKSVYHQGVLSNRRTDTVVQAVKKTWMAQAHQNQLEDVVVTLSLQKRPANTQQAWVDSGIKQELTGFIVETMTKEASATMPKYDVYGKELEYRWVESDIRGTGDSEVVDKTKKDGAIETFTLAHNIADAKDGPEHYVSVNDGMGTITNTLVGETSYRIDKVWAQAPHDQEPAVYGKTPPKSGAKIAAKLLQNYKDYADENGNTYIYPMDGRTTTDDPADLYEFRPYSLQIDHLPKFDDRGSKYVYAAEEAQKYEAWHSTYQYNVTDDDGAFWDAQIKNNPVGPGDVIKLRKVWLDDGDVQHRKPVTFAVYRKPMAGETTPHYFGTKTLSEKENWWGYFGVNEKNRPQGTPEYYIREIQMDTSTVLDKSGNAVTDNSDKPDGNTYDTVQTAHHKYEVTYAMVNGEYVARNRRIGIVNLTVNKTWVDAGADKAARPEAELRLSIVEPGYDTMVHSDRIELVAGRPLYILDNSPTNPQKTGSVQQVDRANDQSSYYFFNLPKFDADGKIVHYQVAEVPKNAQDFSDKEYVSKVLSSTYEVGELRAVDT